MTARLRGAARATGIDVSRDPSLVTDSSLSGAAVDALVHHLFTMACNNAWSNLRLVRACLLLSDDDFAARRTGFFPSIKATLNHIVTVDWYYVSALERSIAGLPVDPDARDVFDPEEPFATARELWPAQRDVDRRLVAACRGLDERALQVHVAILRDAGVHLEPVPRMLAHLFQHQIHHRGQAHAMLAGTSVAPPQLDEFFCANEAHLRGAELADLGLSEAEIWPVSTPPTDVGASAR